jgi:hypothetical protein
MTRTLLAITASLALIAALVAAFVIGGNRRCDTLRAEHAPAYKITRYCA